MYNITKYYCQAIFKSTRFKLKYIFILLGFVILLDFFGVFTHMFEITYDESFTYPYEGNIQPLVAALRHGEKPDVPPINEYNYTFIHSPMHKCSSNNYQTIKIVFFIKSALDHFDKRTAIRNSWGFENRFSDVLSKTIFLLGIHPNNEEIQALINLEVMKHKDIIQADFIDEYYNNTIKTMMGFKWAVEYCSNSQFYMFVDDDVYVSVKNVLRFIRNPASYPDYLKNVEQLIKSKREVKTINLQSTKMSKKILTRLHPYAARKHSSLLPSLLDSHLTYDTTLLSLDGKELKSTEPNSLSVKEMTAFRRKRQVFDFELPSDVRLFAGFVFISSPHRHKSSKWYVSLEEYPYHLWPPYVTAGAYIISREVLLDMYYTSLYTKHFRFDDIFLGLVAKKAEIEPFHCEEFHFYKKDYTKYNYKYIITSHGYGDPEELLRVWNEQKSLGNA